MIPVIGEIHPAYAGDIMTSSRVNYYSLAPTNSSTNRTQVEKYLREAIRSAYDSTQEFAASELDDWVNELMRKVDDNFLNWYFSYGNQKAQEFGIPFA
jgi:L-lactate utilization protein LutB